MARYLVARAGAAALTLLLASVLVFGSLLLVPGDPAQAILGLEASPQALEALHRQLGLDQPPLRRYVSWLARVARGDLGESIRYGQPVAELIAARLSLTVPLVALSMAVGGAFALGFGILAARFRDGPADWLVRSVALGGAVLPTFWVGLMLIVFFSVRLGLLPSGGFSGWGNVGQALRDLALPVLTLSLARMALLTRMVRGSLLEVLEQPFVRTARAKGLSERRVLVRHALKNALIPVVTVLGLEFAQLLTAGVVVETVFALPGLGQLALTAIEARDYPMVQGIVLVLAGFIVLLHLLVDLLYALIDPRVTFA